MTRIAVVSDSHGARMRMELFARICEREGFACIYHLGDVREDARWLEKRLETDVIGICGNCDWQAGGAREARENVEGKRLLLVHGDRYGVKYGYDRLSYYAEEQNMDVALFGHTHRSFVGYVGGVLLINPGALKNGSYCALTIDSKDIIPRILNVDE